jgi:NADH-quinone oxidoreductase subunit N
MIGVLNSGLAAAYYLRLALVAAQRPEQEVKETIAPQQVGIAVGAGLLMAVAATLALGILPGTVLRAADAGAHTLEAPPAENAPVNPMLPQ